MDNAEFFLGTVTAVSSADGVQIRLDGQDESMSKYYKMLITGANWPSVGDRVVIMKHSGTYVVMGKIGTPSQNAGKVNRGGDTMTGALTIADASSVVKDNRITSGTAPSSDIYGRSYYLNDSNGFNIATLQLMSLANGREGFQLVAGKKVNGVNKFNYMRLNLDANGDPVVELNAAAAWRSALNALNKSGDIMTGSLTFSAGNAGIYEDTTAYEVGVPPSSDFYTIGLRNRDKNGTVFTAFNSALLSNGNIAARMIATKGSISNYLQLVIDSNNNQSISVSNAQAWRKALGLGNASGAFPITVAQGGTGNTGIVVVDTIANIISAASGFTITQAAFCAWGKIAMIYVRAKATEATSSGWHTVGTVVSGKRPAVMLHASELNFGASSFYITGEIQVYGAMTADKNLYLSATYLLA